LNTLFKNNLLLLDGSRAGKGGENEEKVGEMRKRRGK